MNPGQDAEWWYGMGVLQSFELGERVAIVTGAGRGLGRGMALALAEAGAGVAVFDIDAGAVEQVADEIRGLGVRSLALGVDVGDSADVEQATDRVAAEMGGLDVLVNNAGVTTQRRFEELEEAAWQRVLQVNLSGIYHCCKWAARRMLAQGRGGSIINISSMSAFVGNRGGYNSHYCATKGGVVALTRSLAVEWAPHGIRVNSIAPGYMVTPMTDRLRVRDPGFYQELVDRVPLGRFGQPEDLSGAVVYLASAASAYVTGSVLVVDGAYTAW